MEVHIVRPGEAAGDLAGPVIILDIFRASNTIRALLEAGAAQVMLIAGLDEARELKASHHQWLLWGERGGVMPPDFDGGNSPAAAARQDLSHMNLILTTSAGTQAVHLLKGAAGPVLFGSFANAKALARVVDSLGEEQVNLLPMGLEAREPAVEDDLCAEYLAGLFRGEPPSFADILPRLQDCDGARRLKRLNQTDDLELCTALDTSQVVPRVDYSGPHPAAMPWAP